MDHLLKQLFSPPPSGQGSPSSYSHNQNYDETSETSDDDETDYSLMTESELFLLLARAHGAGELIMSPWDVLENTWKKMSPTFGISNSFKMLTGKAGSTVLREPDLVLRKRDEEKQEMALSTFVTIATTMGMGTAQTGRILAGRTCRSRTGMIMMIMKRRRRGR